MSQLLLLFNLFLLLNSVLTTTGSDTIIPASLNYQLEVRDSRPDPGPPDKVDKSARIFFGGGFGGFGRMCCGGFFRCGGFGRLGGYGGGYGGFGGFG